MKRLLAGFVLAFALSAAVGYAGTTTYPPGGTAVTASQSGSWSVRTQDGAGNLLLSTTTTPGGSDRGLIVRIAGGGTGLTDSELRATPVPVSGTLTCNAGSGTLAVSGPLTDGQLRATPVPVSGTVAASQSGTWSVRAQDGSGNALASSTSAPAGTEQALITRNIPSGTQAVSGTLTCNAGSGTLAVSGPLTDSELRATAVPVSGTVTCSGPLTDAQLRAIAVPISGTVTANAGTGTMAVSAASLPLPSGASQEHVTAASPHAARLSDGTAFYDGCKTGQLPSALVGGRLDINVGNTPTVTANAGTGTFTVSGTVTANAGTGTLAVSGPLTDGQLRATAVPVSGTVTCSGPLTDTQLRATAVPVSGTVTANAGTGTMAVSGTVTANAGTGTLSVNAAQVAGTAVAAHGGSTLEAPLLTSAFAETTEDSDANTNANRVSADADKVRLIDRKSVV